MESHKPRLRVVSEERGAVAERPRETREERQRRRIRRRISIKLVLVMLVFAAVGVYLMFTVYDIKMTHGGEYERRALANLINSGQDPDSVIVAARGEVLDRGGRTLIASDMICDVFIDIVKLDTLAGEYSSNELYKADKEKNSSENDKLHVCARETAKILGVEETDILTLFEKDENGGLIMPYYYYPAPGGKGVPYETGQMIRDNEDIAHIYVVNVPRHTYPYGGVAAAVLGFRRGDGLSGLENEYDNELSGSDGRAFRARDKDGLISTIRNDAEDGLTLITTIDYQMQVEAEAIAKKHADEYKAKNASIIIMDINSGEIYAFAQYPSFKPGDPTDHTAINRAEDAEAFAGLREAADEAEAAAEAALLAASAARGLPDGVALDKDMLEDYVKVFDTDTEKALTEAARLEEIMGADAPLYKSAAEAKRAGQNYWDEYYRRYIWSNINVSYAYEPGSIFKPITVAAAMEEGAIGEDDQFYCGGTYDVGGWTIPCNNEKAHGWQTPEAALANSCNVAMMQIVEKIGPEKFYKYQTEFGFGAVTGIDLPGEADGMIFPVYPAYAGGAYLGESELATSSFGQRFRCTPIQACAAFAAVVNGGKLIRPHILSRQVDGVGQTVKTVETKLVRTVISKETSDWMRNALTSVFTPSGTGWRAIIDGYSIGGKTGTGEQGIKDTQGYSQSLSFIAYLPADAPKYLVYVMLDRIAPEDYIDNVSTPGYMMKDMLTYIIEYKDIKKTTEMRQGNSDMVTLGNFAGVSVAEAVEWLNKAGLNYQFVGSGGTAVVSQTPSGGAVMPKGEKVYLVIGSNASSEEGGGAEETANVPDVVGMPLGEADAVLKEAGFSLIAVWESGGQGAADAVVKSQTPDGGAVFPVGAQIRVTVGGDV